MSQPINRTGRSRSTHLGRRGGVEAGLWLVWVLPNVLDVPDQVPLLVVGAGAPPVQAHAPAGGGEGGGRQGGREGGG